MQYFVLYASLVTYAATVYAIKCYSCESAYEVNCAEDFELENRFKLDCAFSVPPRYLDDDLSTPNATACMKRTYQENGVQKHLRSCFFGDVNETEVGCRMDPTLLGVQNVSCHICYNENFCNGAMQQQQHAQLEKWKVAVVIGFMLLTKLFKLT